MRAESVLKEIHALPGTQRETAVHDGYRKLYLRQSCLQMSGHIVEPFVVVLVRPILWSEPIEVSSNVALYCRIGILLDQ
jgi:hypothetical protein